MGGHQSAHGVSKQGRPGYWRRGPRALIERIVLGRRGCRRRGWRRFVGNCVPCRHPHKKSLIICQARRRRRLAIFITTPSKFEKPVNSLNEHYKHSILIYNSFRILVLYFCLF